VAMYEKPVASVYPEVVRLAGGPDAIANLASNHIDSDDAIGALHLTDIALASDPNNRKALQARLKALEILRSRCKNTNERGWLDFSIRTTTARLGNK